MTTDARCWARVQCWCLNRHDGRRHHFAPGRGVGLCGTEPTAQRPEGDVAAAIARVEKSRQSHVDWAEHLAVCEHCRETTEETVGSIERNTRVAEEYANVLAVLRSISQRPEPEPGARGPKGAQGPSGFDTTAPLPRLESGRLACYDCGLPYSDPGWCDAVIPNADWLTISPTGHEGGVLCLTCMARRLVAGGSAGVPLKITSGPWDWSPQRPEGVTVTEAQIQAVIDAHQYMPSGLRGASRCSCGTQFHGMPHDYRAHLATEVAAEVSGDTEAGEPDA